MDSKENDGGGINAITIEEWRRRNPATRTISDVGAWWLVVPKRRVLARLTAEERCQDRAHE